MNQVFSSPSPCKSLNQSRRKYSLKHHNSKTSDLSLQKPSPPSSFKPLNRMLPDPIPSSVKNGQISEEPSKAQLIIAKNNGAPPKRKQILNVKSVTSLNIINEQIPINSQYYRRVNPHQFTNVKNIIQNEVINLENLTETVDSFNYSSSLRLTAKSNESVQKQNNMKKQINQIPSELKLSKNVSIAQQYQRTNKDNKDKVSLRRNQNIIRSVKSEVYVCLKYADLKIAAKPVQQKMVRQKKETNLPISNIRKSTFIKKMCQNLKAGDKEGCKCEPKCHWINKWLDMARFKSIFKIIKPKINSEDLNKATQQIQKDITRTYPTNPTFQNHQYIQALREILISYCKLDCEVGYVQGMNMIAASIIYHSSNIQDSLTILDLIMRGHEQRKFYLNNLAFGQTLAKKLMVQLRWLAYDIYNYLKEQNVELQMFVTSWYFSMMGTFVPLTQMHLIIDTFLRKGFAGLNQIILTLLIYLRDELLVRQEEQLMEFFSTQEMTKYTANIDWAQLVRSSNCLQVRPLQF